MGLYNVLFGVNPITPLLLKILDIDQPNGRYKSGRFRDIHLNSDGTKIILFTRNGGGNREHYFPKNIRDHPNYLTDYDDSFDNTYAYIEFSMPEKFKKILGKVATGKEPEKISEKFQRVIEDLEKGKNTKETRRAMEVGKKIFKKMEQGDEVIEI